jgi:hypothetical protein
MAIDFPNSPTVDDTFAVGDVTWIWDGTTWRSVGQPTPGRFVVSETAPSGPTTGDAWFKSSTGQTFVYYDSFWVETSVSPTGPAGAPGTYNVSATAPASPEAGNAWFNTTDGRMYVWSGTEWFEPVSGLQGANGVYNFGEDAPAAPAIGQGWVNTNTGKMYIWSGTEWFEPTNNGASASTVSLTGGSTIIPQTPSTIGLITRGAPGQTADLQQWQNLSGTIVAEVAADGSAFFTNTGQNAIINGAFDFWQRGTSVNAGVFTYISDRWATVATHSGGTVNYSRQLFTPGTSPVAGVPNFLRMTATSPTGASANTLYQRIEDVNSFAGSIITFSFYARADAARTVNLNIVQDFGTGGSSQVGATGTAITVTTTMQRFSYTVAIPSIIGKTVGANSFLLMEFQFPVNTTSTIEMTGVQVESGSLATPFKRAGGTIQAELAACQRYYQRFVAEASFSYLRASGGGYTSGVARLDASPVVSMRTKPSAIDFSSNIRLINPAEGSIVAITSLSLSSNSSSNSFGFDGNVSSGLTVNMFYRLQANNDPNAFVGFSAEL